MACGDGVEQLLVLNGRGALDQPCHQRVSVYLSEVRGSGCLGAPGAQ
jgi:hypothetical protein